MINTDFSKLESFKFLMYFFLIIALLLPGISFFYLEVEVYFEFLNQLDLWQFIFISLFYSIPIFSLYFFGELINSPALIDKKNQELNYQEMIFTSSFYLVEITFLSSFLKYLSKTFNLNYDFRVIYFTSSILFFILFYLVTRKYLEK